MPAFDEDAVEYPLQAPREWEVLKQHVDLDVDFPCRALRGSTEITIQPLLKDLREIRLHSRQCRPTSIQAGGLTAKWEYDDPYRKTHMSSKSTVHQHEMLKQRIKSSLRPSPEPELVITLPAKLKISEIPADAIAAQPLLNGTLASQKGEGDAMAVETPMVEKAQQQMQQFNTIKITIEFEADNFRDGVHWIGCDVSDKRYPYFYTKLEPWAGNSSSIFPCLDNANDRCSWEIAIRCPRTLGDAFRKPKAEAVLTNGDTRSSPDGDVEMVNGTDSISKKPGAGKPWPDEFLIDINEEDAALDLTVVCVGDIADDVADPEDETRHTVTFSLSEPVTARHIGFAVGPFEHVDLTTTRDMDEDKLGQTAVPVDGYCLPGRSEELDNTCFPICKALDHMNVKYGRYPFASYQMLFVDDAVFDTAAAAGLSICSTRLLFPQDIIEPIDRNTRKLIRALADQWSGVKIIPKEPVDSWAVAAIAGWLTDIYMKELAGNNQYRWEQKLANEKVYELDVERPSIYQLGTLLHVDPTIREFLDLKSALVLGILDRRLIKSSGSTGVMRIVSKIFLNATTGTLYNGELSTQDFQRTCERLGHNKLDSFFRQWVFGAGVPIFHVSQRFNKKKLVVELVIVQRQRDRTTKPPFGPGNFMREAKEHVQEVWAPETQPVFTGPMTIRIHEADGTPYEHIVEIKEATTKLEIPYNTKYKRLKRSRKQKERAFAEGNNAEEGGGESLLYCLGDILDSEQEVREWRLEDWSKEDEDKMGQESYEWIRLDADFEWIGHIHLVMPLYMYVSQLQQDRDLVAQYDSMSHLLGSNSHAISLSILVRTLMDERYFYGIRERAAKGISKLGTDKLSGLAQHHLKKAFAEMFCEDAEATMPRPNDFQNRVNFIMQCTIPKAMVQLKDEEGRVPKDIRQFFVNMLKFNDNSDNAFSDCHYIATLMDCLAESLVISHRMIQPSAATQYEFNFGDEEPEEPEEPYNPDADFEEMAVNEIERYRRIDEWILTYQNIYSTTAIACLEKLTKAGIVKDKTKELLQYTRPSTADNVRLEAFRCINELGLTRRMPVMRHLVYSLVNDPSPHFRERMLKLFGEALGHIAFGDEDEEKPSAAPPPADGLVLEEEPNDASRKIEVSRKLTAEGALAALKATMQNEETFKRALWYAATSPDLSLDEIAAFCEIAALMYDAVTSHTVMLKLPRPYKCVHEGRGKMRFYQQGAYRTAPSKGLALDDYKTLQGLDLKYTGPLAEDTKKHLKVEQEAMKQRMLKVQTETQNAPTTAGQYAMAPPPAPTPTAEKSGFKISLGGPKRKASVDLGARESSPKAIKVSKGSTSIASRKPSLAGNRGKPVVLKLGLKASMEVEKILASPQQPGRSSIARSPSTSLSQQSRANTPGMTPGASTLMPSPGPGGLTSPSSSFAAAATPAPLKLNLGGFRSFGPTPPAETSTPAPFVTSPAQETIKRESDTPPATNGLATSPPHPLSLTNRVPSTSNSPPAPAVNGNNNMAPPPGPPKKKFTLKLGAKSVSKPSSDSQGSPPG